jgi:tetratricopeptide (TPR) repeat protein
MKADESVNRKAVLLRLNRIAKERPRNVSKLERYVQLDLPSSCRWLMEIAVEDGPPAGMVLDKVLRGGNNPSLAVLVYERLPARTVALVNVAVTVTRQLLAVVRGGTKQKDLERGSLINNLATWLAVGGNYEEACDEASRAVRFFRRCAKRQPGTFASYLATAETSFAIRLADCNRPYLALSAAKRAVALWRQRPSRHQIENKSELARALMTLSNRHGAVGEREDSLVTSTEATKIFRQLKARHREFEEAYAGALFISASRLSELGRDDEALPIIGEATKLASILESRSKDAFEELYGAAANTYAVVLLNCNEPIKAKIYVREAVQRFERLYESHPYRFCVDLVSSLNTLADCESALGEKQAAIVIARKAVRFAEESLSRVGALAGPYLTMALTNLAHRCLIGGRVAEACTAAQRSVRLCRQAVRRYPERRPELVNALIHWAEALRRSNDFRPALRAGIEAVKLARPLARDDFRAFGVKLGSALGTLAACRWDAGEHDVAMVLRLERIEVGRLLCDLSWTLHAPELATGLMAMAEQCRRKKRFDDAWDAITEARVITKKLSATAPQQYRSKLNAIRAIAAAIRRNDSDPI